MSDLLETINSLLKYADPERSAHKKLLSLRDKVQRKVMLGPKSLKYIEELIQIKDNIECARLQSNGKCNIPGKRECKFTERYKSCPWYEAPRGLPKGSPLKGIGG